MAIATTPDRTRRTRSADILTLAVVLLGFLVLPMSMSGASVAVPRIGADLQSSGATTQWVVTAYFLTASSFMLVAGSLGDAVGRRRIYRLGAATYTVGSLAAAFAPTIAVLLAARVVTGLGAAGVMAGGGAILAATFTGPARARAFAAVGAISGLGLALGPTLSGWLIDTLDWRAGFGVFSGPGLALVVGARLVWETRADTRQRINMAGAVAFVAAIAALMLAATQGSSQGWVAPPVLASLVGAAAAFTVFVLVERRTVSPVLDLSLLRRRRFVGWLLALATMSGGFIGVIAYLPSYLQDPVGLTAAEAGLVMILPSLPMIIMPLAGGRLINRGLPPALLITAALLAIAAGNAALALLHPEVTPLALAGPLVLIGAGAGLAAGIIDAQAMNDVGDGQIGMAAGMLSTVRGTTSAVVIALFGSALIAILTGKLGSSELAGRVATGNIPDGADASLLADRLTDTWRLVLVAVAVLCALAAVVTGRLVRRAPSGTPDRGGDPAKASARAGG
jgi:Arabinose efflux permease